MKVSEIMKILGSYAGAEPFIDMLTDTILENEIGRERWGGMYCYWRDGALSIKPLSPQKISEYSAEAEKEVLEKLLSCECDENDLLKRCHDVLVDCRGKHVDLVNRLSENSGIQRRAAGVVGQLKFGKEHA
jgi:hypothetical protein